MASLELRNEIYRVVFMFRGRKHGFSLGTQNRSIAEQLTKGIETLLWELEQGYKSLPEGIDLIDFLRSGGKTPTATVDAPLPQKQSLGNLRDRYVAILEGGSVETNTLSTIKTHLSHLIHSLGSTFDVRGLTQADLQNHIDQRCRKKVHGKPLSPTTIRKEIASFRACWNWAVQTQLIQGPFPNSGLRFPKEDEKPPFQTYEQIERQIARGGLSQREVRELWDCLFLSIDEIAELLAYVQEHATQPFLYPMCCVAAHTGARRSEILRVKIDDLDFEGKTILIREKKKSAAKRTSRRVPMTPFLESVLRTWLEVHPGGTQLFSQPVGVPRSKKKRQTATSITRDEAHDHLQRTLRGGKWSVMKGWHTLRHSFISACATRGVDQRLVQEWAGHLSAEMSRRYTHLYPHAQQAAINQVFG